MGRGWLILKAIRVMQPVTEGMTWIIPDLEGVARRELVVVLEERLGCELGGHLKPGAFQQHRDPVGQQVGGLRGEGEGEQLAVAEDLSAHKFLCGEEGAHT